MDRRLDSKVHSLSFTRKLANRKNNVVSRCALEPFSYVKIEVLESIIRKIAFFERDIAPITDQLKPQTIVLD